MISTLKLSKIAPVLSALWNTHTSAVLSSYLADAQYRAVLALCMPRLLHIHAHNARVLGAHLLSFSEFNLVKLGQQLLDQGLVTQLRAQLALDDKSGAQYTAEQLLREYEASDTRGRVRIILNALVHLSRESAIDTCHGALLSHALHWHEVSLVIALACQTATPAESLSLPTLMRVLVQHSALLDCHVLVLALNADHVRWSDIVNALVDCHNVPQREARARVKAALSVLDRLEHVCASEARDATAPWHHSHVIDVITRRLLATCHPADLSCVSLSLDSTVTINGNNGEIDHLFDVLLDICFHEDATQACDPSHELYLAEHVISLLHHISLRAVLRRDQIDHVMTQLIVLLRRAEGATTQELHRLIRKVNEFSAESSAVPEDKSRDQSASELTNQQQRWRALMQSQARDGAELGALVNHVPQLFSSLNTLIRLVPQFTHVFNSPQSPLEISAEFEAHVQKLFLDTERAPHRTLSLLREMKRDLSDDQLLQIAPHVISTLLPILVRADESRDHHVINTFVSIWKRVHSLNPEHVMQCTTRALVDDPQQLRTDPLRLFELLPKMVVHPQLFSALFLEMIIYWRVVSERHLRVTGVKDDHVLVLCQLQTSAIIQELLHACQHASLQLCDAGVKEQIATAVCRYVHQEFIEIPAMPKLVHFQGYDAALIPITTAGIPSMHVCLDFIPELLQSPNLEKQAFALKLAGHLINKYPIQKSQHLASLVLQHIKQWHESANDTCHAYSTVIDTTLVLCCQSFPFLVESALELLQSLDTDTCHVLQSMVRAKVLAPPK